MKRGERRRRGGLDSFGDRLASGEVTGAKQAQPIDQEHLFERRAADEPAVIELRASKRPGETGLATRDTRNAALDEEARGDDAAPCGDALEARWCLVGSRIEMPRAARQSVEQGRAIAAVAARQDVGRIGRPEKDALAPQVRRPGLVGPRPMRDEPAADERFTNRSAAFPRGRCGKVAQPGEALERLAGAARRRGCGEVEVGQRDDLAPDHELPGHDLRAALPVAGDMVARDGGKLQWLALAAQPAE